MTSATSGFSSFHFPRIPVHAGDFPSDVARAVRPFGFARRVLSLLSEGSCHADMTLQALGPGGSDLGDSGVCLHRVSVTAGLSIQRTPDLLRNDHVILHIQEMGRRTVSQLGREAAVSAGSGVLSSNADISTVVLPEPSRFVSIGVPRKLMLAMVPSLEDAFVRQLPPNPSVLRLLTGYADVLEDEDTSRTPDLQRAAAMHIQDLFALAIGTTRDGAEIARQRGLPAARLRAIKDHIVHNLGEEDLSPAAVAACQRVTPRYIHKLFESEGTTLSQFVLARRLARVHRMLRDPRYAHRTIGALAFDVGFGDLSAFNRAFRRHFGVTPSDVRAAALK